MKLKITFIALFSCAILFSQSFLEVQLPAPDKLSPLFIGPLVKSTIHYGVTPPNYNGKVIVFNHGYIDLNQGQFLFDNSFYRDTYNEGYQAVFVATTRGGGIWINGELLAESIDIVTNKYNVSEVYLVGHSNGGKASEAAMFQYGKNSKVTRAFALGTPFWGTYLADISQMPWLNWAWRLTGLNEGARTSTTYYCRDVVRPILDNHPNNDPEKFVILGASGFYKGSTIAAAAFLVTGGILLPVQGANDGVAPYSSTLRPGAEYVFRKNDSRAIFDHLDVGLGQFSWPYVKSYIENPSLRSNFESNIKAENSKIASNYYIVHSQNEYDKIILDKDSKYAVAEILHENPKAFFDLYDQTKKIKNYTKHVTQDHQTVIPITDGELTLKSNSNFAAFIKQDSGIRLEFQNIKTGNASLLKAGLFSNKKNFHTPKNTEVRAVITQKITDQGIQIDGDPKIVTFTQEKDHFYFDTSVLEDGVYSLFLHAESEGNFKRNIISGFVVGDIQNVINTNIDTPVINEKNELQIVPNAVKNEAYLVLETPLTAQSIQVTIYDITGKEVKSWELPNEQISRYDISNQVQSLHAGIYLLKVENFKTIKFIKTN